MDLSSTDSGAAATRRRTPTACEACRATKIRCQPSEQPGVCRKCLESKRECVSRTGPRTRRPRRPKVPLDGSTSPPSSSAAAAASNADAATESTTASTASSSSLPPPAPPKPSANTFTINFDMPVPEDTNDAFETLRESHEVMIDNYFPQDEDGTSSSLATWSASPGSSLFSSKPTGAAPPSHSVESLQGKPQFNLASAEALLAAFRPMLDRFPCIVLPDDATVPQLAASQPFVLLAILAVGSGSKTLQGHSLYDDEFRKVLGLKFVAGGERTLELLQGMLVYCAWYPFQLRPKNKQVFHYIRMAADLIHDLELDQEIPGLVEGATPNDEQLACVRAYVGHSYLISSIVISWTKYKSLAQGSAAWTAYCCDVLERHAQCDGDVVLTAAVRLSNVASDILEATHNRHGQTEHQDRLLLLGVEARLREEQRRIPTLPSQGGPNSLLKHISMFLDVYIDGCGLLVIPRLKFSAPSLPPLSGRLYPCVVALRAFMDDLERHDRATMAAFTCLDWGRFVLAIVLGFRLSFYMTECPDFDSAWARQTLRLSEFLGLMSGDGDGDNDDGTSTSSKASKAVPTSAASKVDVLSASRVVFGVVRDKYDKRVEGAERAARAAEAAAKIRQPLDCPMLDGSLEEYLPLWDPSIAGGKAGGPMGIGMGMGAGPGAGTGTGAAPLHAHDTGRPQPIFHDLWATMTMGWASEDVEDREETF